MIIDNWSRWLRWLPVCCRLRSISVLAWSLILQDISSSCRNFPWRSRKNGHLEKGLGSTSSGSSGFAVFSLLTPGMKRRSYTSDLTLKTGHSSGLSRRGKWKPWALHARCMFSNVCLQMSRSGGGCLTFNGLVVILLKVTSTWLWEMCISGRKVARIMVEFSSWNEGGRTRVIVVQG